MATLARFGYEGAAAPVWLQSFEVGNLVALAAHDAAAARAADRGHRRPVRLGCSPAIRAPTPSSSRRAGLAGIARYAQAIGPPKALIIARARG